MKKDFQRDIYTDRDYLDEKFKSLGNKVDSLETKVESLHETILGNGKKGLVEIAKENRESITQIIWAGGIGMAFLLVTHLKVAADFIVGFIENRLGIK